MVIVLTKSLDTYIIAHVYLSALPQNTTKVTLFLHLVKTNLNRSYTPSHTIKCQTTWRLS